MIGENSGGSALLAVEALIESLHKFGIITDEQANQILHAIEAKADQADGVDPSGSKRAAPLRNAKANISTNLFGK